MKIFLSIILAFILWTIIFVVRPYNFWLMMACATTLLSAITIIFGRPLLDRSEINLKNILLGAGSAILLYFIFWIGKSLLPYFIPQSAENLNSIYANRGELSEGLIAILLFFPIGFGEELFWRGFIQRQLSGKYGPLIAFTVTLIVYTAIHLPTKNPVLILAALTCGAFWGLLYWLTGSIVPVLVSHMLWDPFIFVIRPLL